MSENHCINTLSTGHMLPHTDIHLPPCSIGRLAYRLMECVLLNDGRTHDIGCNSAGGLLLQVTFPREGQQMKFTEQANSIINCWPTGDTNAPTFDLKDPNWNATMATYLQLYREMQEKFQPLFDYLDGVQEEEALKKLDKACGLNSGLNKAVQAFTKFMQSYQTETQPFSAQFSGHLK